MGVFDNYKTEGLDEQAKDVLGGFVVHDSDIYVADVKLAYLHTAPSGAKCIAFEFTLPGGKSYREDVYFTNGKGEHFFKTKDDKKAPLPGFTTVNEVCVIASGKELHQQATEPKVVKVWDSKEKKELPKEVQMLTELLGQKVALGLLKVLENKQEKGADGEYKAVAATRETNRINKVFHPEYQVTVNEARETPKGQTPKPEFWGNWLKKNKGQVRDEREIKDGRGAPPASGGEAPAGERKSLFS